MKERGSFGVARVRRRSHPGRLAAFLVLGIAACGGDGAGEGYRVLRVGDPAPSYHASNLGGTAVALEDYRGSPLLLNIWATWCVPCRAEMPELQDLHERYGDRVRVVGVSIDRPGSSAQIQGFLEDVGVDFEILHDPEERIVRSFTTIGVPETFLIDAEGTVRHRWVGQYAPLSDENLAILEGVLGG